MGIMCGMGGGPSDVASLGDDDRRGALLALGGLAILGFQQATGYPLLQERDCGVLHFRTIRRHLRLHFLAGDFQQPAVAGITRDDNRAAAAARHDAAHAGQVEPALFLVGIVATAAGIRHGRLDVILESDLVRRHDRQHGDRNAENNQRGCGNVVMA